MIQTIKNHLLYAIIPIVALLAPLSVPALASAQVLQGACDSTNTLKIPDSTSGAPTGAGTNCNDTASTTKFNNILTNVVNIFTAIVGIIAVIMIIVGGFKYITSGGESNAVSGAKKTILFAIIGLIIVVLAQVIVRFVLAKTAAV